MPSKISYLTGISGLLPLHLSEYAKQWGGKLGDCPVTEDVSDRLLRLPFFNGMTPEIQGQVIEAIRGFNADV